MGPSRKPRPHADYPHRLLMKTSFRRRVFLRIVLWLGPWLYRAYMSLVFLTSRVEQEDLRQLFAGAESGGISLGAVWHQDVFVGGFLLRERKIVTMASQSSDGEIAATFVRRLGYIPVRGSSSRRGKEALGEMLEYVRTHRGVTAGLSVDGPRGPAHQSKMGIVVLAREAGAPIFPLRVWARRRVLVRSWDRTMIPLPFNHIVAWVGEPLVVPPESDGEDLEACRAELDSRLNDLVRQSLERFP